MSQIADFQSHRIEGFVHQSGAMVCVPLFTQIDGNLWMGGAPVGSLPHEFKYALDLYGHAEYLVSDDQTRTRVKLLDSSTESLDRALLETLADWVNTSCKFGQTLVHCQAGLNRSGLVTALALIRRGMTAVDAIALLRAKRDQQVLCNTTFANWLQGKSLGHEPEAWA